MERDKESREREDALRYQNQEIEKLRERNDMLEQ